MNGEKLFNKLRAKQQGWSSIFNDKRKNYLPHFCLYLILDLLLNFRVKDVKDTRMLNI